jgi:hypothetical protein
VAIGKREEARAAASKSLLESEDTTINPFTGEPYSSTVNAGYSAGGAGYSMSGPTASDFAKLLGDTNSIRAKTSTAASGSPAAANTNIPQKFAEKVATNTSAICDGCVIQ